MQFCIFFIGDDFGEKPVCPVQWILLRSAMLISISTV